MAVITTWPHCWSAAYVKVAMLVDAIRNLLLMKFLEKKCSVNQHGRLVMWLQTKSFGVYCKDVYTPKMYGRKGHA